MTRSGAGGGKWKQRQEKDRFVQQARKEGWRSRAVFKLQQIAAKERFLRPDMVCVDLGCAPGGWCQFVAAATKGRARIIGIDLLHMDPLADVEFIQGDFTDDDILEQLKLRVPDQGVDLVLCDMAPNMSGIRGVDQPKSMYLAELALDFATNALRSGGSFVCKLFQGEGFDEYLRCARSHFVTAKTVKPEASRPGSREVYFVGRDYGR